MIHQISQVGVMRELFSFYFTRLFMFDRIGPGVASGRLFREPFVGRLRLDAGFAEDFHKGLEGLRVISRRCRSESYTSMLACSHLVRLVSCLVAWVAPSCGLVMGLLQFAVAPLSLPIAVMKVITYGPEGVVHYVCSFLLGPLLGGYGPSFTIGLPFLFFFIAVDQSISFYFYMSMSEPFALARLMKHIAYGTANTKLYYVVVFGCLQGLEVDIMLILLTSGLTLLFNHFFMIRLLELTRFPGHDVRFYMDHVLGHLPVVYTHAHKQHHHLHDATPWDAHTYGNGMNEHFLLMVLDALPCMLAPSWRIVPYCFNAHLLYITLINKPHHTRCKPGSAFHDDNHNFHADHHTYHNKNFALAGGALLDFYFGTQAPNAQVVGLGGMIVGRHEVKAEDGSVSKIEIDVAAKALPGKTD